MKLRHLPILLLSVSGLLLGCLAASPYRGQKQSRSRQLPAGAVQQFGEDAPRRLFGNREGGCFAVSFSRDGQQIATGHARDAKRWEVATGRMLAVYPNPRGTVHATAFSPDGKSLAWGGFGNSFALFDLGTDQRVAEPDVGVCVGFYLDFSADGAQLVSDSGGGRGNRWDEVLLWDVASGRVLERFRVGGVCWNARITPDGKTVVSGDTKGWVSLFNVETGKLESRFSVDGGSVLDLQLTSDGKRIVAVSSYPVPYVVIVDLESGRELIRIPHKAVVRAVAVSPDGAIVATGGNKKGIRLFDSKNGAAIGSFEGHVGGVSSLAFSPDGKSLLSGGFRGKALLWDVASGLERR